MYWHWWRLKGKVLGLWYGWHPIGETSAPSWYRVEAAKLNPIRRNGLRYYLRKAISCQS